MIRPLVDYLIERGISGIYPLGSTGEGPLFSTDERKAIAAATVEAVAGRLPVIVHTGAITTAETLALSRHARDIGANAASIITPWYFSLNEAALEAHYRAIYDALPDFPIYLYNLPALTGNTLVSGAGVPPCAKLRKLRRAERQQRRLADDVRDQSPAGRVLQYLHRSRYADPGRLVDGAGCLGQRAQQCLSRARGRDI